LNLQEGCAGMKFKYHQLKNEISVRSLVTCYYFELSKTFRYDGEKHNFWEIVYVDKGEVAANTDTGTYSLKQGDLLFHEPNEFHNLVSNGRIAPNIFIITFVCSSEGMAYFTRNKKFRLDEFERSTLARLMKEGLQLFAAVSNPSSDSGVEAPGSDDNVSRFASQQLVKIYLEMLLIHFFRNNQRKEDRSFASSTRKNQAQLLADKIIAFLTANLGRKWTLQQICAEFGIGRTQINILFKEATGSGIIEYCNQLKIEQAKSYIRGEIYNLTEVAELLGYSSLHYFSRHFKNATGMTPSEYSKTIKTRMAIDVPSVNK